MLQSPDDTIAAVSTPAGASAIAIVRLSGRDAFPVLRGLVVSPGPGLPAAPSYRACQATLRLRPGGPLVPASLYLMPGPRSYTRDDVAEVHTLGSPPLVRALLDALVRRGARVAEPGEFTRRAFLNGRITLDQAEAVLGIVQAACEAELRAAVRSLRGRHARHIHQLHGDLLGLRAQVEASIDFAQHDIELIAPDDLLAAVDHALALVGRELRNADAGALPPEGIRVALCGLPNAGKSSLFNALLSRPRTIVTPIPGTTRDAVAERLILDGIPFRLYDTAGLGSLAVADPIDADAASRARGLIGGTHVALVVVDASEPVGDAERRLWHDIHAPQKVLVLNKADLPTAISDAHAAALAPDAPVLRASALTRRGLDDLAALLVRTVRTGAVDASPTDLIWNARHRQAFRRARQALRRARQAVVVGLGAEFVAADLRAAHDALASITGQIVAEDILDVIFAQFCIGK